jgi:hypothetical protein
MMKRHISGIFARVRASKTRASRYRRLLGVALVSCSASGCGNDAKTHALEPAPQVWIGEVQDTDVKVALADRKTSVALFFCGGNDSYAGSTRWFAEGASLEHAFSFKSGAWSVDGAVDGAVARGNVQIDTNDPEPWITRAPDAGTLAGLYEGEAPCGKLGLIVTQQRPQDSPTGQGACLRVDGDSVVVEQVNPVRLAAQSAEREIAVTVASAPGREFTVRPVAGAPE